MALKEKRQYWLDGYSGAARGGVFYRSKIAVEVDEFETKFKEKIVAIAIEPKFDSDKPSWTIEFILDAANQPKHLEGITTKSRESVELGE